MTSRPHKIMIPKNSELCPCDVSSEKVGWQGAWAVMCSIEVAGRIIQCSSVQYPDFKASSANSQENTVSRCGMSLFPRDLILLSCLPLLHLLGKQLEYELGFQVQILQSLAFWKRLAFSGQNQTYHRYWVKKNLYFRKDLGQRVLQRWGEGQSK